MQPVFVDTFYWIALLNPDDPDHDRVTAFDLAPERPPLVTTEEVLTEFLTYFSGRGTLFRRKAAAIAYALRDDPDVRLRQLLPSRSRRTVRDHNAHLRERNNFAHLYPHVIRNLQTIS